MWYLYALAILTPLLASYGHILIKRQSLINLQKKGFSLTKYIPFLTGCFIFFISSVVAIYVMTVFDFSVFFAFTGLNYVFITIFSKIILKERIDKWKIVGNAIIVLGVIVYNLGGSH